MPIGALISGLKSAAEMSKGLLDLRDQAMVQKKVIELNKAILAAQQSAVSSQKEELKLIEEIAQLKRRIAELEGKEDDRSRYIRTEIGSGSFAYKLKDGPKEGEVDHALCAPCFEQGRSSTLQPLGSTGVLVHCPTCKNRFRIAEPRRPEVVRAPGRLTRSRFGG